MSTKADIIMDACIKILSNYNYTVDDIHLLDYDAWHDIGRDMEKYLRNNNLDLSYQSDYSEKYNIKLAGNATSIVSDFRYFFMYNYYTSWQKTDNIPIDMINNANGYYKKDRYGYVIKISKDEFINLISTIKNSSYHIGIGSQASIIETIISLFMDSKNNFLYDSSILTYD